MRLSLVATQLRALQVVLTTGLCSGCCIGNCGIPDLTFVSLQPPPEQSLSVPGVPRLYRLAFKPDDLQLRFATQRDLFRLGERNDVVDWSLRVSPCADRQKFVGLGYVFTDDGWSVSTTAYQINLVAGRAPRLDAGTPQRPSLQPISDGRFIYQAAVSLNRLFHEVKGQYGYHLEDVPLPADPASWPPLCMTVGGIGYSVFATSNVVPVPPGAVVAAIEALSRRHTVALR